jgi:carboxypeptidase C (cathepsin A)
MFQHVLLTLLLVSFAAGLQAQEVTPSNEFAVSSHQIDLNGRTMRYTAHAGLLPIRNAETSDLMARIFITAYRAERQPGEAPRPVTFIWNGGPGANSSQTHLVGFGPMGFETPATYPEWIAAPPTRIGPRPETWLATSDLVFVDPVGTGYPTMEPRTVVHEPVGYSSGPRD